MESEQIITMSYDIKAIRSQFPILKQQVYGKPLVYFDNGATTQKPQSVIDAQMGVYTQYNSNIHRGVHHLSNVCTDAFESARLKVQSFINAAHSHEIIFTRGTTEAINLLAHSLGESILKPGAEILISAMEHHANIVPWQMIAQRKGMTLKVIPISDNGELLMDEYEKMVSSRTGLVAITHISNVMGTINPIKQIIDIAHSHNVPVMIDAAQSIQHHPIDVQKLDCDFLVFSGHKMYAPTGTGVLYGKEEYLNRMSPWHGGGEMIEKVTFEKTTYNKLPFKFEAGTPDYAGAIALGAAIDFINSIGIENIEEYESNLYRYAIHRLGEIPNIRFIGEAKERSGAISFLLGNHHPFDVGTLLDKMGIAVRTGHHCAQPLMQRFNIPGTVRASLALYNTSEEIDKLIDGMMKTATILG